MNIAIDIGHANGTGARGNGLEEHATSSKIAEKLVTLLREGGNEVSVIDFPEMSNSDDLNSTVNAANKGGYNFGVSIHCDCSDNSNAKGAHVCYYSNSGKVLATAISEYLCKLIPGRADKIVRRDNLAVLKKTNPVWVLCECGFISNKDDASMMKNNPDKIAQEIFRGIRDYISKK